MSFVKGSLTVIGFTFLLWLVAGQAYAQAEPISPPDYSLSNEALEDIHAQGISVGGDSSISCSTDSSSICLGTYEWNDNHQFDASDHKGAIQMDGNVQQNVSAEINLNQTQGAGAVGVTVLGDSTMTNSTLNLTNNNSATSFIGGF
jgi:hypothetical protein